MKRRILAIALTLCMLLSLLPASASAAETNYDLYINNFRFSSSNLTYTSGSGSATYNPSANTLTIKNLSLSTGGANTIIESKISGLTIKIDGTLTLNLLASKVEGSTDLGKVQTNYGIAVFAGTTICGANNSASKDSIVIKSISEGVDSSNFYDETTRVGICNHSTNKLTIENLTVSMTDNSTGDYAGHASMIRTEGPLDISGCKLVTEKCQFGFYVDAYAPATVRNTVFDMTLNGTDSSGVNFAPSVGNVMQNCSGSISAKYPIYTAGELTVSGTDKLTLIAGSSGMLAGQNQDQTPGKLIIDNANVEIQSDDKGLEAEVGASITMKSGTVNVTKAARGVRVDQTSSFTLQGGTLSIRGKDTTDCIGVNNIGAMSLTGGSLKVENVYTAIQNTSSTALSISGGEHTLTAATCGYLGSTSSELKLSGANTKVTINAETGIQLPAESGGKLTVSGGELNINATVRGINLVDSTSAMTLSGGKVNVTDKNSTPTIYGMYCRGNTQFTGAEVTFNNCKSDLLVANSNSKMTGGKLHLSGSNFGAQLTFNFEMTGGEIDGSTGAFGFVVTQGTTSFKSGTVNLTADYPFYVTNGATVDFAGANVTGNSTSNCGLYVVASDTETEVNSYKISGGTVVLTSSQAGANELYTSIPSNYGVWAGADEAGAVLVENPTKSTLISSKYVRFAEKKAVTLTLVNVKEGTSASYLPGESFTYTAKDAPSGKHFSHWELTVNGTPTTVGTDTTYSGKMPAGNATLTAVYENCSGGTATCKQKAVCATCGREYGELGAHDFTAEAAEAKYLKTDATCTEAAVYYKSCAVCGESSKDTAYEATFSYGEAKGHAWGDWTSNGDGTHSRTCGNDKDHKETEDCSGGTADCTHGPFCDFCHAEYGKPGDHNYTAEVAEDAYLKDAATCTEAAVYYKSCTGCGASSEGTAFEATFSHGEAKGHAWGDWASNGDGTHSRTCGNDKDHKETKDCSGGTATCQQKAVCAFCHAEYGELAAHGYTAEAAEDAYLKDAATCTEAAVYYKSCAVCGTSSEGTAFEAIFSYGEALGHQEVTDPGHDATCTEDGLTEGKHCDRCKLVLVEQSTIPALGHNVTGGTVTREPTCTEDGERVGTCERCGAADVTAKIGKLGHDETTVSGTAPTCAEAGWSDYVSCVRCGEVLQERTPLAPLAHTVVEDAETDTLTKGLHCSVCGEVLQAQFSKTGGHWTDDGNYDAELYASEPGNWVLSDAADFAAFAKKVNDGNNFQGFTVTLTADIDLSAHHWVPIGLYNYDNHKGFCGTFRGGLHTVSGMRVYLDGTAECCVTGGLFGYVYGAEITDLIVSGDEFFFAKSDEQSYVGGLAGRVCKSTIRNCGFVGTIGTDGRNRDYANVSIGGLAGIFDDFYGEITVENCYAIANVNTMNIRDAYYIGGLVGKAGNKVTVSNCYAVAAVTLNGISTSNGGRGTFEGGQQTHAATTNCYTQLASVGSNGNATVLTREQMQSADGLVKLLNAYVSKNGNGKDRAWYINPAENQGYPVFGFAVRFETGIEGEEATVVGVKPGSTVDPSDVTVPGYIPQGWFADEECTTAFDFSKPITADTTVYGKFAPGVFTITYILNGGENAATNPTEYLYGVGAELADATRENYLFEGWYTDAALTRRITEIGTEQTGDLILFAKWSLDPNHPHVYGACRVGENGLHEQVCEICGKVEACTYTTTVTEPTCTSSGYTTHTCDVCGNSYVDTFVEGGHIWNAVLTGPTHTEMGYTTFTCSRCKESYTSNYVPPIGHSFDDGVVTKEATCTEEGEMLYTCACGETYTVPIAKADHELVATVTEPTCTELGFTTHACKNCDYAYTDTYVAPNGHSFDDGTVTKEPSCTAEGEMLYTCACGESYTAPIAKVDHVLEAVVTAPTCTEPGFTTHACKNCDFAYTDTFVAPTGHDWDEGKVASAPTLTETGILVQTCGNCGATVETSIPMLTACDGGNGCPSKAYVDVPDESNWAHVGIDFVLKAGLFYGTSETTFDPDATMTRAMLVTVLYRLEGKPATNAENPFDDIADGMWYTDAVVWAAENGIVLGVGENIFNPDGKITREQMATILYRYTKFKGLPLNDGDYVEEYPDIDKVSPYAAEAMRWANAEGLINGMSNGKTVTLAPQGDATRAQVAAILMRYVQNVLTK